MILKRFLIAFFGLALMISACGQNSTATPAVATAPAALAAMPVRMASANPEKGKLVFLQCRACHSLEQDGTNKVGPNLWGVFGRKAAQTPGFNYSAALQASPVIWGDETLDKWLERPSEFIPGNQMIFVGLRKPEDRADVIAYIRRETGAK